MKIKEKALIEYFGKKNIDEDTLANKDYVIKLDLLSYPEMNLNEILSIVNQFPSIKGVTILTSNAEVVESLVQDLPSIISISLEMVSKKLFDELKPEVSRRIYSVSFNNKDKYVELINVGDINRKFPNLSSLEYNCLLSEGVNITNLNQIDYLLQKSAMINLTPELLEKYKDLYGDYSDDNFISNQNGDIIIGNQTLYSDNVFEQWNQSSNNQYFMEGCLLKEPAFLDLLKRNSEKEIILCASSMAEVPLDVAENLHKQGIKCKIYIKAFDNAYCQNEVYELDEYIEMSRKMDELIGDIDENLPEEQRFRLIYERVTKYLDYDYPAAYPKNREEKKYSQEQVRNCRNLRNGLLFGKTVCAGYADILKNACLIKGIECEYIQGPVDSIQNKEAYIMKEKSNNEEVIYSDGQDIITREYHAWNKVKINGVWYNCDPTWDRDDIINGRTPKYALISDEVFKKLGRPTVEVLRHPCTKNIFGLEKNSIFFGMQPAENLVVSNKFLEFESTVDEYGRPRQLPVIPKVFPWTRMMLKLKKFANEKQTTIKEKFQKMTQKIQKKINLDFYKTEQLPVVEEKNDENIENLYTSEITEKLKTVDKTEPLPIPPIFTEPLPVVGNAKSLPTIEKKGRQEKKASWELSDDELSAVRKVEKKQSVNQNEEQFKDRENEIGD